MQYIVGFENYKNSNRTAVTLGKFDGLHLGHEKLVRKVIECSANDGVDSVVCSFDMSPLFQELHKERKIIMTEAERRKRLDGRVDYLIDCPFTTGFSRIPAEAFIEQILVGTLHASYVIVGTDFCFGHNKRGDIHMLKQYEEKFGYRLIVLEKERYGDRIISSSYIKEAITEGKMELANRLLGYPYTITGTVEHGKQLGRTLGFPTMNVAPAPDKLLPPKGVYMLRVNVGGTWYPAIGNVGVKPTVTDDHRMLVESFLLDYSGDAYGEEVCVELLEFRRPEMKFSSVEEMKACVDRDIAYGKKFFSRFCAK